MRGVTMRDTLKGGGCMWYTSPSKLTLKQCENRWARSTPCESYDIFLSHTWMTQGVGKYLAISLQSGWSVAICFWAFGVALTVMLCIWQVLPVPAETPVKIAGQHVVTLPTAPWTIISSMTFLILGFLVAPYLPLLGRASDTCFLDVACVCQSDRELTERAVYGLGGFLVRAHELRVLWSPPYLTRLWCVFELAAYRPANPSGKISFRPISMELSVLIGVPTVHLTNFFMYVSVMHFETLAPLIPFSAIAFACCVHLLRRSQRTRHQLLADLQNFDLRNADCTHAFDRDFVMSAIARWYGSSKAFTKYVRGPLRQELAPSINRTGLWPGYIVMLCLSGVSVQAQVCVQHWINGISPELLLRFVLANVLAYSLLWTYCVARLLLHLSSRFSALWRVDFLVSIMVGLGIWLMNLVGWVIGQAAAQRGMVQTGLWVLLTSIVSFVTLRRSWH
eukprot:s338_g17.t1